MKTLLRNAALTVPPIGRLYRVAIETAQANRDLSERLAAANDARAQLEQQLQAVESARAANSADDLTAVPTGALATAFADRLRDLPGNAFHALFDSAGFHLLRKHFYVPLPEMNEIKPEDWTTPSPLTGVDMNEAAAHELMDVVLPPYLAEFRNRFPIHAGPDQQGFHLINGAYMAVDAHLLYGLVRHNKPRRIVEIGNGSTTMVALAAAEMNRAEGYPVHVVSVDPYPSAAFANGYPGLDELIAKPVQDVPQSLFAGLQAHDILFIDSTHVLRWKNDVDYLYLTILPLLQNGVLVHVHDVSLPMPYPKVYFDNQLYWNEQYLLQAFLIYNSRFKVLWPGNHMMLRDPAKMLAVFPEIADMREVYPSSEPTAFWMQVRADA